MTTPREPPARSNAILDQQIAAIEGRLQRDRTTARSRTRAVLQGMRDSLTSPLALLIATGAGFAAHRFDLLHRPKPRPAASAEPSQLDSPLDGMLRAFSLAATLIALLPDVPPSGASEVAGDQRH
jgi:hypothetical protein